MKTLITLCILFMTQLIYAAIPGNSIYQIDDMWQNSLGEEIQLQQLKGKKQVVALMYSHCLHACPIIVANMKKIERAAQAKNKDIGFVLVTLSPATDTVDVLHKFAKKMDMDESKWSLIRADNASVRRLAMALELSYKPLKNNMYSHSRSLVVLDEKGRVDFLSPGLPDGVTRFIEKLL